MATSATNSTENLGLSQWAADDYVLREDFNSDNAAIDAGFAQLEGSLSDLSDTVDTKAAASALSAHIGDNAAHSALFEQKATVSALTAETSARQAGDYYTKLFDITATASVSQIDLDCAAIDMTAYSCLRLAVHMPSARHGFSVRVNNNANSDYLLSGLISGVSFSSYPCTSSTVLLNTYGKGSAAAGYIDSTLMDLTLTGGHIHGFLRNIGKGFFEAFAGTAADAYTPANLSSLNLVGTFEAGTTIVAYGIKA